MTSQFCFPLSDVKKRGQLAISAVAPPESFPDALSEGMLVGPVALEGIIRAVDDEAAFSGTAKGMWKFECTRCLAPIEQTWSTAIEIMAPIDGGPLDIADEVRQSIVLLQPMKILCRPDCKGLCALCAQNRNAANCGHTD